MCIEKHHGEIRRKNAEMSNEIKVKSLKKRSKVIIEKSKKTMSKKSL